MPIKKLLVDNEITKGATRKLSHIVSIQTKLRDPVAIAAACRRQGLNAPVTGTAELFGGPVSGLMVRLPDWQYPIVVDLPTGDVKFDNFEGAWGERVHLDRFLQAYAVEKTKLEARTKGFQVSEQSLADGSIRVQIIDAA